MPTGFKQGDLIDDAYEVIERIGEGGFGDVYRVRQLSMSRDVALKILLQEDEENQRLAGRFRREVLAVRNLSHPNTVRIFDFSETSEGYLYYTMEYLEGDTLTEHIAETEGVPPLEVRDILVQVLKSLSEAHSRGIVHRDLKPGNVMLAEVHGETNFVKVLDFGIAKAANTGSSDLPEQNLTSAENIVGTLRYMAPEQAKESPIGPYTDLYTLGLVGLELLTGEKVFAGMSNVEILKEQLKPEPLDIPEPFGSSPLGEILSRALAKDVDERFESADAMRKELEALNEDQLTSSANLESLPVNSEPYLEDEEESGPESSEAAKSTGESSDQEPREIDSSEAVKGARADEGTGPEPSPTTDETPESDEDGGGIPSPSEVERDRVREPDSESSPPAIPDDEIEEIEAQTEDAAPSNREVAPTLDSKEMPSDEIPLHDAEREPDDEAGGPSAEGATGFDEEDVELSPEPSTFLGLSYSQTVGLGAGVALFAIIGLIIALYQGGGASSNSGGTHEAVAATGPDGGSDEGSAVAAAGQEDASVGTGTDEADAEGGARMVTVETDGPDARVFRGDEKLGTTPLEVEVDGQVMLELRAGDETQGVVLTPESESPETVEFGSSDEVAKSGDAGAVPGTDVADAPKVAEEGGAASDDEATGTPESRDEGGREPEPDYEPPPDDHDPPPSDSEPSPAEEDEDESEDKKNKKKEEPAVPVFD